MRVLLLSRYSRLGASSRVRSLQFLPYLRDKGWTIDVRPLFSDSYLQALYGGRRRELLVVEGYWRRSLDLFRARNYDLVWFEKELFPFLPAIAERLLATLGVAYVVDYDDACFHRYDTNQRWLIRSALGRKIDEVMRNASIVIAGNDYLAQRARLAGARRVEIVPTVVDLARYSAAANRDPQVLSVGWIGSPATANYLSEFGPICDTLSSQYPVQFIAVGARAEQLAGSPFAAVPWSEGTEVESIQTFDVGVMPLLDSPWERGKCGYKLIQYMACHLPVVASPVGVNRCIVKQGVSGFLAENQAQWKEALSKLLGDSSLRRRMGAEGRKQVESWYSLQVQAPRLVGIVQDAVGSQR